MHSLTQPLGRARPPATESFRGKVRAKLRTRAPVLGINPGFSSPDLVAFCAQQGADLIFIDCEHGGPDAETVCAMVYAAHAQGAAAVLRPWTKEPGVLRRFVDLGVDGFIYPDLESTQELRALHQLVTDLEAPDAANFLHIALLESENAIGQIEAICATGLADAVLVGSGDLAASMGLSRKEDHARVRELSFEVLERACRAGVSAGAPVVRYGTQATFAAGGNLVMLFAADLIRTALTEECAAIQSPP